MEEASTEHYTELAQPVSIVPMDGVPPKPAPLQIEPRHTGVIMTHTEPYDPMLRHETFSFHYWSCCGSRHPQSTSCEYPIQWPAVENDVVVGMLKSPVKTPKPSPKPPGRNIRVHVKHTENEQTDFLHLIIMSDASILELKQKINSLRIDMPIVQQRLFFPPVDSNIQVQLEDNAAPLYFYNISDESTVIVIMQPDELPNDQTDLKQLAKIQQRRGARRTERSRSSVSVRISAPGRRVHIRSLDTATTDSLKVALPYDISITALSLSGNHLNSSSTHNLVEVLQIDSHVTVLELCACKVTDNIMTELADALTHNYSLCSVNFNGNLIGDDGAAVLSAIVSGNPNISKLDLNYNYIWNSGLKAYCEGLCKTDSISSLSMIANLIGGDGLGDALQIVLQPSSDNLSSLTFIDFSWCPIQSSGLVSLSAALRGNQTVEELRLSSCDIGDAGVMALADLMLSGAEFCLLTTLDLSCNHIGDRGAFTLAQGIKSKSDFVSIDLSHNQIADLGACALAIAAYQHESFNALHLSHNRITDAGAICFASALEFCPQLSVLDLSFNTIGERGLDLLLVAQTGNSSIEVLVHDQSC